MSEHTTKSEEARGGLYLVATPIGNAEDLSPRALRILKEADAVLCEDTRRLMDLLRRHDARAKKLLLYHDRSPPSRRAKALRLLKEGATLALVSDRGTPLIADPGYKLVREAIKAGIPLHVAPGPSGVLAALLLSGLPPDRFAFLGFPPPREGPRLRLFRAWREASCTLIFFQPARRLKERLQEMLEVFGDRPAALAREMTKTHQETERGSLQELARLYQSRDAPKGEITIVLGGAPKKAKKAKKAKKTQADG